MQFRIKTFLVVFICSMFLFSCNPKKVNKEEQISVNPSDIQGNQDSLFNSVKGNVSFSQIPTKPNAVILTGLANHRLVTVYKSKQENGSSVGWNDYNGNESEEMEHFMPGIDILYGYNLLNIAHYDFKTEKMNFLFNIPVLIKTVYYPAFEQDSINKKPINRSYYLISVYDEDTNKDTIINKKDLRRFYCFDSTSTVKTLLVPADYTVIRSQYDSENDVMYLFARQDSNKNGMGENSEPIHIFWIDLKNPTKAKRLY